MSIISGWKRYTELDSQDLGVVGDLVGEEIDNRRHIQLQSIHGFSNHRVKVAGVDVGETELLDEKGEMDLQSRDFK